MRWLAALALRVIHKLFSELWRQCKLMRSTWIADSQFYRTNRYNGELYWLQVDLPLRLSGQSLKKRVNKVLFYVSMRTFRAFCIVFITISRWKLVLNDRLSILINAHCTVSCIRIWQNDHVLSYLLLYGMLRFSMFYISYTIIVSYTIVILYNDNCTELC